MTLIIHRGPDRSRKRETLALWTAEAIMTGKTIVVVSGSHEEAIDHRFRVESILAVVGVPAERFDEFVRLKYPGSDPEPLKGSAEAMAAAVEPMRTILDDDPNRPRPLGRRATHVIIDDPAGRT